MLFDGWGLHLSPASDNVQGHPFYAANNINQIAITSIADYQVIPLDPARQCSGGGGERLGPAAKLPLEAFLPDRRIRRVVPGQRSQRSQRYQTPRARTGKLANPLAGTPARPSPPPRTPP
jgi:hypothetical protein